MPEEMLTIMRWFFIGLYNSSKNTLCSKSSDFFRDIRFLRILQVQDFCFTVIFFCQVVKLLVANGADPTCKIGDAKAPIECITDEETKTAILHEFKGFKIYTAARNGDANLVSFGRFFSKLFYIS